MIAVRRIITADPGAVRERKFVLPEERYNSTNFLTLWDFEGVFKYSPLFYGWYTNRDYNDSAVLNSWDRKNNHTHGYRLPFAYFVTGLVVYAYSFFATLRKMAENSRMSKLSEKDDECIFSWKLFTAWDYMIGNAETAHNRVASIVMGFKEALLEEAEKKRESRNWKVICFRVLVNTLVLGLLSFSVVAVVIVVRRSTEPEANNTVWRRNEITVVITLISFFFPMLFEVLGLVEQYHPRKQLRLQLARIMVLNLLNLYALIFALFDKITDMTILLQEFKTNLSKPSSTDTFLSTTPLTFDASTQIYSDITIQCVCNESLMRNPNVVVSLDMIYGIAENLSEFAMPKLKEIATLISRTSSTEDTSPSDFITNTSENILSNVTEAIFNSSTSLFEEPSSFQPENFTYYYENSSVYWDDNSTNYFNSSIFNNTKDMVLNFNETFSLEELKDMFVDYLTYILSPFSYLNNTDSEPSGSSNIIFNNSHVIQNSTEDPLNTSTVHYEYFKTTISPFFTNTFSQEEQRFETELTTVFDEISTTIATSLEELSTETLTSTTPGTDEIVNSREEFYCLHYCKSVFKSKSTSVLPITVTTTAIATVNYGDIEYRKILNYTMNAKLRSLCWETMFGQELLKLTLLDLIMSGLTIFFIDFIRGIFVRFMNKCWCWDLEKKFPQYGDFKVAENILHLVNNQGMVWMGMFFSPGLVVLNVFKLYILMYLRAWAVLTCNVPHEIIFRASRSNNFYYALLLMMLFLCVLPVGYAIVWIEPSWHCGPFSGYPRIFHIFTKTIRANVPESMHRALDYIASPGIVIPLLLLLVLIIYYLVSLTNALREANNDLKTQLRRERTEERRKMFQLADKRRRCGSGESNDQTPFSKWKKLMGNLPSTRSCDEARQESEDLVPSQKDEEEEEGEKAESKSKVFLTKLIRKALGKSSSSEEEQDATDTDQHDSLPYDNKDEKSMQASNSGGSLELNTLQSIVSRWSLRRNSNREDKNLNSEEKRSKNGDESESNNTLGTAKQNVANEHKTRTAKENLEKSEDFLLNEDEPTSKGYQETAANKRKKAENTDIEVIRTIDPKSHNLEKQQKVEEKSSDLRKAAHKRKKPPVSSEIWGRSVSSKVNDKQKHSRIPKENEGDDFLKRVLEANKSGIFNQESNVDLEYEPKAAMSHERKQKRQREKDYFKMKNKPKRPIIEIDEESVDIEEPCDLHFREFPVSAKDNFIDKQIIIRQDSSSSNWSDKIPVITISKTYSDENIPKKENNWASPGKKKENNSPKKDSKVSTHPGKAEKKNKIASANEHRTRGRRIFVFKDEDIDDDDDDINEVTEIELEQPNEKQIKSPKEISPFKPKIRCALKKQVTAIDEDVIIHFGNNLEQVEKEKQVFENLRDETIISHDVVPGTDNSSQLIQGSSISQETFLVPSLETLSSRSEDCIGSDKSTSDDTEMKEDCSRNTVLNSPYYITEGNSGSKEITSSVKVDQGRDSTESQTDLELEVDATDSIDHETECSSLHSEEMKKEPDGEAREKLDGNFSQLQRPSIRSSSRSQTESSSYYKE